MNVVRLAGVLAVAVALPLSACGKGEAADPPADIGAGETMETMEPGESPTMEGGGPETPRTGDGGVAVSLPGLPVGGGTDGDELTVRQCAVASWTGSDLSEGVSVAVTRVDFNPTGVFEVDGSSCGEHPGCAESFAFTSEQQQCSVPVRALASNGDHTGMVLSGACASQDVQKCRDVKANSSPSSVPLDQPTDDSEEQSPSTEPTETTTTG